LRELYLESLCQPIRVGTSRLDDEFPINIIETDSGALSKTN
jgi:hypothetical protein